MTSRQLEHGQPGTLAAQHLPGAAVSIQLGKRRKQPRRQYRRDPEYTRIPAGDCAHRLFTPMPDQSSKILAIDQGLIAGHQKRRGTIVRQSRNSDSYR